MIDLEKPVKRKVKIFNKEYMLTFNRLGIIFREKGARDSGKLLEWDRALLVLNGFSVKNMKSDIKKTKSGTTLVKRGLLK
jgi:hypothetical protein